MALPRLQLFEVNDLTWAPQALRESLIESLSRSLAWGRMLRGLTGPFAQFLEETGAKEILELCSGAGGPVEVLVDELRRAGRPPPKFWLTDILPHAERWAAMRERHPEAIDFIAEPVDATAIPPGLAKGRAKMIVNALHHLPPKTAGELLREACREGPGIFVAEGFERNPLRFLPFVPIGLVCVLLNPLLSPTSRLQKLALLPLTLCTAPFDGVVSTLRVYSEEELREMVAPLGDSFFWRYGTYPFPLGGRGYWFSGVRREGRFQVVEKIGSTL